VVVSIDPGGPLSVRDSHPLNSMATTSLLGASGRYEKQSAPFHPVHRHGPRPLILRTICEQIASVGRVGVGSAASTTTAEPRDRLILIGRCWNR
jgi:hypothetical protein